MTDFFNSFCGTRRSVLAITALSVGLLADGLIVAPVNAQEASPVLEEVIVTARKREENIFDIPESISAITGEEIDRRNIKGLNKVGMAVPNMNLSMRTDGYPNVSIRGIGAFGLTQGVGFYLDDVQLFGDASSRFGDLDRIEILKGPQGVLYGGSNIGGAVKFVSKRPTSGESSGRLKVIAGEQSIFDLEGSANLALGQNWAARVFGFTRTDDGFLTNPNSPSPVFGVVSNQPTDVGASEEFGGRIAIQGPLSENLTLHASVRYNESDGPGNNWARELSSDFQYPFTLDTNFNPYHERETFGAYLELEWELENVTITSLSSYTDTESTRFTDVDLTQFWFFNTFQPETVKVTTQEIRFTSTNDGPMQWVAGLFYSDFEETMNSTLNFGWFVLGADDPTVNVIVPFETRQEDNANLAAFGNLTYDIGDWELGFGVRVDRWEADEVALDIGHSASKSDTEILPRLSVTRNLDNGITYLTLAKGFEPGGWNGIADGAPPVFDPDGNPTLLGFDPEEAMQYEIGWKGEFQGGRGAATIAAFYSNYEDRQYEFIAPNPNGSGLIEGVVNVGDSTQMGLELSVQYQVSEYLLLNGAFGLIDAEWDNGTVLVDGTDLSGQEPPNIVTPSFAGGLSFRMPAGNSSFDWVADLQISYNGKVAGGKP